MRHIKHIKYIINFSLLKPISNYVCFRREFFFNKMSAENRIVKVLLLVRSPRFLICALQILMQAADHFFFSLSFSFFLMISVYLD